MTKRRLHFGVTETAVGLVLHDGVPFELWAALMRRASRDRSASQWRLGDLARFGEARFGRMYEQAIAESGLSYQTVANIKAVAAKFEISRRRENLSFGHHAEVAALPAAEQDRLLDLAEKSRWSRNELRQRVQDASFDTPAKPRTMRLETTSRPLFGGVVSVPVAQHCHSIPLLGRPVGASDTPRSATDADPVKWIKDKEPPPIRVIGGSSEASTLEAALRDLEAWERRHARVINSVAAGYVRQAREAIERQLSAVKGDEVKERPEHDRRRLH